MALNPEDFRDIELNSAQVKQLDRFRQDLNECRIPPKVTARLLARGARMIYDAEHCRPQRMGDFTLAGITEAAGIVQQMVLENKVKAECHLTLPETLKQFADWVWLEMIQGMETYCKCAWGSAGRRPFHAPLPRYRPYSPVRGR